METTVPGLVKIILGGAIADKDENKSENGAEPDIDSGLRSIFALC